MAVAVILTLLTATGCAGPGPRLAPAGPIAFRHHPPDGRDAVYDFEGDGRADYAERFGADGAPLRLLFDWDGDGRSDVDVPPPRLARGVVPHLVIILDSVPFELVREFHDHGRFAQFHPPGRVIAPFPVMTDLSLAELFGVAPCVAMESQFYNTRRLNTGYFTYVRTTNAPWLDQVDYDLNYLAHGLAYTDPRPWFGHELRRIEDEVLQRPADATFVGYSVGTSALGSRQGRAGHEYALDRVDRVCRWLIHTFAGRIQITLLSDHGHAIADARPSHSSGGSEWIDLPGLLRREGFRVTDRLTRPGDVVVPGFGMVTCAAVYTREPAAVTDALIGHDRIRLAAYVTPDGAIAVTSREGRARIESADSSEPRVSARAELPAGEPRASARAQAPFGAGPAELPGERPVPRIALTRMKGTGDVGWADPTADGGARDRGDALRLRYVPIDGDPLRLLPILAGGLDADPDGFADKAAWFAATADHEYPDCVYRLWRAFHGLMRFTPDVLLCVEDGSHCGSRLMTSLIGLKGAHGNMGAASSTGFVMSTAGPVPEAVRMEDLAEALAQIGVRVRRAAPAEINAMTQRREGAKNPSELSGLP
ncbi:MAG: hypothetical protein C4547_02585 [Phycisphaerales bacterium]|nr:MAG: hypothetical protein C4547_02585 [Phycisphaerales bacterium]